MDSRSWTLGVSASRAEWLQCWLTRTLDARRVITTELREALGRMVFVYSALQWDKPFLGPLLAFLALRRPNVQRRLPVYVCLVLEWLRDRSRAHRAHLVRRRLNLSGSSLRVDAKAEGKTVAIGGWAPVRDHEGVIRKDQSPWFSLRLTEETAPWAFSKGLPVKTISTLELFASTWA